MEDGLKGPGPDLSRGGKRASLALDPSLAEDDSFDERILGGGAFVDALLGLESGLDTKAPISFDDLEAKVTCYYQVDPERLTQPDKERTLANCKAVLCHVGMRHLRMSGAEIASRSAFTPSGVTRAAKRGEGLLREDETLRKLILQNQ